MFNSLKYKLIRFMHGRYGNDKLNFALLCTYLVTWVLNIIIISNVISLVLDIISLLLLIIIVYRTMSRNVYKRQKENAAFLKYFGRLKQSCDLTINRYKDRHTHIYKKCPNCKAVLRLRKIKGEHTARCPKCNSKIEVKIK